MGVIDLGAASQEFRYISGLLRRLGLPTSLNEAIKQLAATIRDHKHLETILTSCSPEERGVLYESVRPHLKFFPWPLDRYVSAAGQRAEREQWHVMGEDGKLQEFKPAHDVATAQKILASQLAERTLTLTCKKCAKEEKFYQIGMETAVDVRMKALKAGWILVPEVICQDCPTSQRPNA